MKRAHHPRDRGSSPESAWSKLVAFYPLDLFDLKMGVCQPPAFSPNPHPFWLLEAGSLSGGLDRVDGTPPSSD